MRRRARRLVWLPTAAILCAVAGCGSDATLEPRAASTTTTPAATPRPVATPTKAPVRHCVKRPSTCGYPDSSNTGVPPGTKLKPSGPIEVTTPGTVISGLDVRGTIRVGANNVTIRDTRVTEAWTGGSAVLIEPKVSDTVIEDSTIRGQNGGAGSVGVGILNAGWDPNASTVVRRVAMYNCAECYNGPGTLQDSYANVSAVIDGAHYEDVFYGGGNGLLTIDHDTLLNPQPQTAVVYTAAVYGDIANVTVKDSLLAGGGWTIYGGGDKAQGVTITNNRFSALYHRHSGYFGLATGFNWHRTDWKSNYWDETLRPVTG
jgi:hypothetical protein